MRRKIVTHRLAWFWALLILVVCGVKGSAIPEIKFGIGLDKVVHIFLFAVQTWLMIRGDDPIRRRPASGKVWEAIILATLYGVLIETLQAYVFIDRDFDFWDIVANTAGTFMVWFQIRKLPVSKRDSNFTSD